MEAKTETRTFAANLDSLEPIREFLTAEGNSIGLDKKKIYGLCLAVDEIVTNIINHGYIESGLLDGTVDVIISSDNATLTVVLEDSAVPFDPMKHIVPTQEDLSAPLEERPIGGLGVMIAKQSVDEFMYEFVNKKNRNIFIVKV